MLQKQNISYNVGIQCFVRFYHVPQRSKIKRQKVLTLAFFDVLRHSLQDFFFAFEASTSIALTIRERDYEKVSDLSPSLTISERFMTVSKLFWL